MTQANPFAPAQATPAAAPVAAPPVQAPAQPVAAQPAAAPVAVTQPPALPNFQSTGAGLDDPKLQGGHSTQLLPLLPADMQVDIVNVYEFDGHDSGLCTHFVFDVVSSNNPEIAVGTRHRVFYRQSGTKNQVLVNARLRGEVMSAIWQRTDSAFGRDAAEKWLLAPEQQAAFDAGTLRLPVSLRTYMVPKKDANKQPIPGEFHRNEAWSPARR